MISSRRHATSGTRARARIGHLGIALVLAVVTACGSSDATTGKGAATKVAITAADGSRTSLSSMRGAPLVVNMWATWCNPCVREMPAFDQVANDASVTAGGVKIIGVNVADDAPAAAAFATKLGVHYPQFTDPDGLLSTAFDVVNLPATAFVAADGTVLEVHSGAFTADQLRTAILQHFPAATGGTHT